MRYQSLSEFFQTKVIAILNLTVVAMVSENYDVYSAHLNFFQTIQKEENTIAYQKEKHKHVE